MLSLAGGLSASLAANVSQASARAADALGAVADPEAGLSAEQLVTAMVAVNQARVQTAATAMVLRTAQDLSESLLSAPRR